MLKNRLFSSVFMMLAMAGVANAAYSGTPTAKADFATETINSKKCYKIGSAEDLYGFAAIVNGTNGDAEPTACGVLTQNITVNENVLTSAGELNTAPAGGFIEWTPIGKTTLSTAFKGTFYGQGHTISGLYFNNPETDYVGLFAYTTGTVSIDGVGVVDSYFRGKDNVGGLVGYHYNMQSSVKLSVKNSYNAGFVTGTSKVGGLVGGNYRNLSIVVENSYNTGSVNGSSNVGGLVGVNGNIYFSYNTGSVTGNDNVGGLVGSARSNQIIDCYNVGPVKEGDGVGNALLGEGCEEIASGMNNSFYLEGSGSECGSQSFSKTSKEFANGYVALELHNNTAAAGASIWGQVVGADKTPLLTGEIKFLLNDGCFEIANEEDLYLFAAAVNNGVDSKVCAKLTADIKVNEHVLADANGVPKVNSNGAYAGSTTGLREWTPIGNSDHPFIGTFDGDGHTISGLYFNDDAKKYVGLFGYVESSESVDVSIKNVGLEDSYFKANGKVGGVVGLVGDNVDVKIENVYNAAVVSDGGSSGYVGGIVGEFWTYEPSTLNILNSYNSGAVFGNNSVGGLVGGVDGDDVVSSVSVKNCYNYGALSAFDNQGETLIGSVVGSKVSVNISDTYYLKNSALQSTHGGTEMSSTQFADGTVLAALSNAEGGEVWRQYKNDAYPTFVKKSGTTFEPNEDGYYEIATADDLYKFAEIVNGGNATAKAKLMNDITVNDYVLADANGVSKVDSDGAYIGADSASFRKWTPIGTDENWFNGTFDGQGYTISGLYINAPNAANVGLFGYVSGEGVTVSISNVGVEDSYFNAQSAVGGVVGWVDYASLDMKNVYNAAVVVGASFVGGVVGYVGLDSQTLSMTNVYNVGLINCEDVGQAGGLVGEFGNDSEESKVTIKNSYNYGEVVGGNSLVGYVESEYENVENVSVTNSFYKGSSSSGDYGTVKSATEFADGTVLAALRGADESGSWYQYQGDAYPVIFPKDNATGEMHVVTLRYSDTDSTYIAYVEGVATSLPTEDKDGNAIIGWTASADGTGDVITEIPALATTDLKLYPKFNSFEPNADGYYEITSADDLYKFAEIVNNGTVPDAKAKLTADICVNACGEGESVLGTDNANVDANGDYIGSTTGLREWTPIGNNSNPFKGSFDGQGFSISGLYFNDTNVKNVGLFGEVKGPFKGDTPIEVSIENVGVVDSYFKGKAGVAGILGYVEYGTILEMNNVYSAAVVGGGNNVGGIVGGADGTNEHFPEISVTNAYNVGQIVGRSSTGGIVGGADNVFSVSIENCYNYGSVSSDGLPLVGAVGYNKPSVTNSYYLGEAAQGDYGTVKSATEFADGTVYAALHSGENVDVWFLKPGDKYPTLSQEKNGPAVYEVTLNYPKAGSTSEYDPETISYVEGFVKSLPTIDKEGYPILGWYDAGNESSPITEIPATATGTMTLFPKLFVPFVNGCYEIATAEQLYWFAATVNKGNVNACGKLTANIEVNQNVLATADGVSKVNADGSYDTASGEPEKIWTPIGNGTNPFQGTFDGQGYTISGLYFNGENVYDVGLFGRVAGDADGASVANVNVADSYFGDKGETGDHVGGIVGMVAQGGTVAVKNVSSAAVVVGNEDVGGVVGYVLGTEGNLDLDITNAYNVGMVKGSDGVGGLVGDVTIDRAAHKVAINNSYNYGDVSFEKTNGGAPLIGSVKNTADVAKIDVENSYYLGNAAQGDYGTNKSVTEFADGTVLAALRRGEDGYVWVQAEGDKCPTIDINASKNANTVVLAWTTAADSTTLADKGYTEGAMVIVKSGKKFYADGAIYEGILSADQVAAIGRNKLYPISGVKLETVNDKLVATLDGDSQDAVMIPTDVHVDKVVYKRNVQANTFCTIMLPFTVPVAAVSDHSFYKFRRVATDDPDYSYVVKVTSVTTTLKANRPYIMIDSKGSSQIEFVNVEGGLTLNTTAESYEASSTADGITWKMKGVYEYKQWQTGDSEIGRAYLFTAQALGKYKIGQFAKLASGASLRPMRMYLTAETSSPNGGLNRPSRYGISSIVMPENIGIEIEDEELDESVEETTVVKRITIVPMLVQSNRWFDMKGRALNGRPTAKGTYYYNGKRIIIK